VTSSAGGGDSPDVGAGIGAQRPPVLIRAAGGVIWRPVDHGDREVVVVHRPRYDDWTFPKGKAERGESDEDCARREVLEETGLVCDFGPKLPDTTYRDRFNRPKIVHYWAMTVVEARPFVPNNEVDELRWVLASAAGDVLTYGRDRELVQAFLDADLDGPATLRT